MPTKKISTKCNVFLQVVILRPYPHFTRHACKKIRRTIRILHIWKSADPQIRICYLVLLSILIRWFLESWINASSSTNNCTTHSVHNVAMFLSSVWQPTGMPFFLLVCLPILVALSLLIGCLSESCMVGWLVGWSLTSFFGTNTTISETTWTMYNVQLTSKLLILNLLSNVVLLSFRLWYSHICAEKGLQLTN